jgi:hypothetical protein
MLLSGMTPEEVARKEQLKEQETSRKKGIEWIGSIAIRNAVTWRLEAYSMMFGDHFPHTGRLLHHV